MRAAIHARDEALRLLTPGDTSGKALIYQAFARVMKSVCLGLSGSAIDKDIEEFAQTIAEVEEIHEGKLSTEKAQSREYFDELETLRKATGASDTLRSDSEISAALTFWSNRYNDCQKTLSGSEKNESGGLYGRLEQFESAKRALKKDVANPDEMRNLGISDGKNSKGDQLRRCEIKIDLVKEAIAQQETVASGYEEKIAALKRQLAARSEARRTLPDEFFQKK